MINLDDLYESPMIAPVNDELGANGQGGSGGWQSVADAVINFGVSAVLGLAAIGGAVGLVAAPVLALLYGERVLLP